MREILTNILTSMTLAWLVACSGGTGGVTVGGKKGESQPKFDSSLPNWTQLQYEQAHEICMQQFPDYQKNVSKAELPRVCDCVTKAAGKVAVFVDYAANPRSYWQALHLNGQLASCMPGSIQTSPPENQPKWKTPTPLEQESGTVKQPLLMRDNSGYPVFVWTQQGSDGFDIIVRRMDASGWGPIVRVARVNSATAPISVQIKQSNALALAWVPDGKSVLTAQLDAGASAASVGKVSDETSTATIQNVSMAIDSSDQAHVVWQETAPGDDPDVPYRLIYRRYDGTTWSTPYEVISGNSTMPKITTQGTNVLIVWEHREAGIEGIMARTSTKTGWAAVKMIDEANTMKWKSSIPVIAAAGDYAHVVWQSTDSAAKLNVRSFSWQSSSWTEIKTVYSGPIFDRNSIGIHNSGATNITWMTKGGSGVTIMNAVWQSANKTWLASPIAVSLDAEPLLRPRISVNASGDKLLTFAVRKGTKALAYAQVEKAGVWAPSELIVELAGGLEDLSGHLFDDGSAIGLWLQSSDLLYIRRE